MPLAIFYFKPQLGITSSEIEVLLYLLAHRWDSETDPYPSLKKIAIKSGKSVSAIRLNIRSLEKKELIFRNFRVGITNSYSFDRLRGKLDTLIKNSQRASYFQAEGFQDSDTPPYQKTDTKVDTSHLDKTKEALFVDYPYDKKTEVIYSEDEKRLPNEGVKEYMERMKRKNSQRAR